MVSTAIGRRLTKAKSRPGALDVTYSLGRVHRRRRAPHDKIGYRVEGPQGDHRSDDPAGRHMSMCPIGSGGRSVRRSARKSCAGPRGSGREGRGVIGPREGACRSRQVWGRTEGEGREKMKHLWVGAGELYSFSILDVFKIKCT